jgi:sarcosine oxidase subunit gamma
MAEGITLMTDARTVSAVAAAFSYHYFPQLNVRASGAVVARVETAIGVALPVEPNTVASHGPRSALWLGPDEWLVVDEPGSTAADSVGARSIAVLETSIREAFAPDWGAVTDVSANRVVIELSGPGARDLLAHGCTLDLHPRRFGPRRCAQTLLAGAQVILWQTELAPTFRILVRASFADHLLRWLADAAAP